MDHATEPTPYKPPGSKPTPRTTRGQVPVHYGTTTMWLFLSRATQPPPRNVIGEDGPCFSSRAASFQRSMC